MAHGKSTVVKAISGVQTVRFKNELERNITIKLGYANAKIYCAADPACPRSDHCSLKIKQSLVVHGNVRAHLSKAALCHRPNSYRAYSSSKEDNPSCEVVGFQDTHMELLRHVSFVDCPGWCNCQGNFALADMLLQQSGIEIDPFCGEGHCAGHKI